jgi:hypothetical protein
VHRLIESKRALSTVRWVVGWQEDGLVWKEGKGSLLKKRKKKASLNDALMMRRARRGLATAPQYLACSCHELNGGNARAGQARAHGRLRDVGLRQGLRGCALFVG